MQSEVYLRNQSTSQIQSVMHYQFSHQAKKPHINQIENRILPLSPTVQAGIERECSKSDFSNDLENCVGKGSFGKVYKVTHLWTGRPYAIKVLDKRQIVDSQNVHWVKREIEIMYKLNHPHIIKLINHFEDNQKIYLIMPYVSKGQLYKHWRRQSRFDERTASQYVLETIDAVSYLHSLNPSIIHRDIKPENILLNNDFRILWTDFGWADYENTIEESNLICGSKEYMAPEVLKGWYYNKTVDVWAIGVLLFEWLAGYTPFAGNNQTELISNIKKLKISWPKDFPPWAKNLISKILKLNASERWSLEEIKRHAWFTKNKEFRPVMQCLSMTEKEKIESHFINVSPDDVKNEVNNYLNLRKELIYSSINHKKKFSSNKSICMSNNSSGRTSNNNTNHTSNSNVFINFTEKTNEINEWKIKISNFLNTISDLENNLRESKEEHANVVRQNSEIKEYYDKIIAEKDSIISRLECKLTSLQEIESQLQCDNWTWTLEKNAWYSSMNLWMKNNKKHETTIVDLNKQINEINDKKDEITTKLENENNLLKNKFEIFAKEVSEPEEKPVEIIPISNMIALLTKSWLDIKQNFNMKLGKTDAFWYTIKERQKGLQEEHRQEIISKMSEFNGVLYKCKDEWKSVIEKTIDEITQEKSKAQVRWITWLKEQNQKLKEELNKNVNRNNDYKSLEKDYELLNTKHVSLMKECETRDRLGDLYRDRDKESYRSLMDLKYKIQNLKICAGWELGAAPKYNELLAMINDL